MKRFEERARWADLTIRFVVKANRMSARKVDPRAVKDAPVHLITWAFLSFQNNEYTPEHLHTVSHLTLVIFGFLFCRTHLPIFGVFSNGE